MKEIQVPKITTIQILKLPHSQFCKYHNCDNPDFGFFLGIFFTGMTKYRPRLRATEVHVSKQCFRTNVSMLHSFETSLQGVERYDLLSKH